MRTAHRRARSSRTSRRSRPRCASAPPMRRPRLRRPSAHVVSTPAPSASRTRSRRAARTVLAPRVGTLGALVAVLILRVEQVGAIAWKHHAAAAASRYDRWATLRGTEIVLEHAPAGPRPRAADSTLEQVTLARESLER